MVGGDFERPRSETHNSDLPHLLAEGQSERFDMKLALIALFGILSATWACPYLMGNRDGPGDESLDMIPTHLGQRDLQQRFFGTAEDAVAAARADIQETIEILPHLGVRNLVFS